MARDRTANRTKDSSNVATEDEEVIVAGKPMTTEDLEAVEARIAGKRAPLHEDDHPMPKAKVLVTEDGRKISQVGNFQAPQVMGHSGTLKKFARIEPDYDGWTKMNAEHVRIYQGLGVLTGHDGDKRLGLIDQRKLNKIKRQAKEEDNLMNEDILNLLSELEAMQ